MMLKKILKVTTLPIALSAMLVGCSNNDDIIATVEDKEITEAELVAELKAMYGSEVLDTLIADKIVALEADALNISVSKEEIDAEFNNYADAYGGKESLVEALKQYNMTEEKIREDIRTYLLTVKVMSDYVALTDEEVAAYFEENKALYSTPEQAEVSQILVATVEEANDVLEKLKAGEDFATLAEQFSIDAESADDGGAMGMIPTGMMSPEFDNAVFNANIGELVGPIETEEGFHIVKVIDKKEGQEAKLEDVQETVRQELLNTRVDEEYETWLNSKYEEYEIKSKLS